MDITYPEVFPRMKTSAKQNKKCFYKSSQILVKYAFKADNNPAILKS